jgi:hypothetical protein
MLNKKKKREVENAHRLSQIISDAEKLPDADCEEPPGKRDNNTQNKLTQ